MFESDTDVGLWLGESVEEIIEDWDEQLIYELTIRAYTEDPVDEPQDFLPRDLEEIPPGLYLAAIVSSVDPERLNGHDAVRLLQARARLASHHEAGKLQAMVEVA